VSAGSRGPARAWVVLKRCRCLPCRRAGASLITAHKFFSEAAAEAYAMEVIEALRPDVDVYVLEVAE